MTIIRDDGKRIDISLALQNLRPGCKWIVENNSYEGITWLADNDSECPSEFEINQEVKRLELEYSNTRYQRCRKSEYPSLEEQLDMLYHLGYDGWKSEINKIKEKYPKPE